MRKFNNEKLSRVIERFRLFCQKKPDLHIEFCINQESLKQAIEVAAKAVDQHGKIHGHQRRIGRQMLDAFAENLLNFESKIAQAKNFDEVLQIVSKAKTSKIGELVIYDTANRIGCYLNLLPDKVYLHSGTRKGAVELLGKLSNKQYLLLTELPEAFQITDIQASDIEDILCIYKKEFNRMWV